jgi:protocatechuate 3,4-dioxygenase alpha subunit
VTPPGARPAGPDPAAGGAVTPAQTIGPFFGFALPYAGGGAIVPAAHPGAVTVHGFVRDAAGLPVPDAMLEFWQAGADGGLDGAPGSLSRGADGTGADGAEARFTGFARIPTDEDGHYAIRTVIPAALGRPAPYLSVCIFARGLLRHLFTRVYFEDQARANTADPLLAALEPQRRATLVSRLEQPATHRFDIRLRQGGDGGAETVFLDFGR